MKTKSIRQTVAIVGMSRRRNSYYGNPCYSVSFRLESGRLVTGRTATNAMCAYAMPSPLAVSEAQPHICELEYHYTRTGNVIIDYYDRI